jgi:hypothetical protein
LVLVELIPNNGLNEPAGVYTRITQEKLPLLKPEIMRLIVEGDADIDA